MDGKVSYGEHCYQSDRTDLFGILVPELLSEGVLPLVERLADLLVVLVIVLELAASVPLVAALL